MERLGETRPDRHGIVGNAASTRFEPVPPLPFLAAQMMRVPSLAWPSEFFGRKSAAHDSKHRPGWFHSQPRNSEREPRRAGDVCIGCERGCRSCWQGKDAVDFVRASRIEATTRRYRGELSPAHARVPGSRAWAIRTIRPGPSNIVASGQAIAPHAGRRRPEQWYSLEFCSVCHPAWRFQGV